MYWILGNCRKVHARAHTAHTHTHTHTHTHSIKPHDCSEACSFDPSVAGNSSWCCIPMAHAQLWVLQSFPSCRTAGMGGSAGTCLWQASAFTLTLVSWGRLPDSQVTNANKHCLWHRLQHACTRTIQNLQKQEALKYGPDHLKSIGIIVREVLASHVSLSDSRPCPDSGCGLEL